MVKRQRIAKKPTTPPLAADTWVTKGSIEEEMQTTSKADPEPTPLQPKEKSYPHRVSFDMDTTQYKRLKRASFENERAMNEILREAISDWLKARNY